jgi:hypothetical protein
MRVQSRVTLFLAALLLVPTTLATPSSAADPVHHRLAIQVNQNDPAVMNLALNNAVNVVQHYSAAGEEVEIEIVTYGPGLHMLREDTSPVKGRIKYGLRKHERRHEKGRGEGNSAGHTGQGCPCGRGPFDGIAGKWMELCASLGVRVVRRIFFSYPVSFAVET